MSDKIRMSGMISGMDTESLITALTSTHKTKLDKAKGEQKKLSWKQDAWKTMNSKIYGLYSGKLSNMRFSTGFAKMITKSSSSAISVTPGKEASEGTMTAKVNAVAKSGYLTGAQITAQDNSKLTQDSKVTDLGIAVGTKFTIECGDKSKEIEVTEDMTMYGLTSAMKEAGVNANFDVDNKRMFISSKAAGEANDFKISADTTEGNDAIAALGLTGEGSTRINGSDAELVLNGATFKSSSNSFVINGSTYTVSAVTDEEATLTTQKDTSGIYGMIKDFFDEYNTTMNAMAKAYNAESSSKYSMLTDEMKDVMSDKEVEEWEEKIKDSLLRKDSTLSSVMSAMKNAMASSIEIDGKKYSLADFGIETLSYFEADENDRYGYHIAGNKDDTYTSGKTDKLESMIAANPELVQKFFTKLADTVYSELSDKMASTDYSSAYKVYDDKKMKTEYDSYTKKISDLEKKLSAAEDRYYKKYAAMEKALATLQDSNSAISSLFNM